MKVVDLDKLKFFSFYRIGIDLSILGFDGKLDSPFYFQRSGEEFPKQNPCSLFRREIERAFFGAYSIAL